MTLALFGIDMEPCFHPPRAAGPLDRLDAGLATAIADHRAGRLGAAADGYRAVIDAARDLAPAGGLTAVAHGNLGALLLDQGTPDSAATHLRQAVALCPDLAEAHFNLGRIGEQAGDMAAALDHYGAAHCFAPQSAKYLSQLVHAQLKSCHWDELAGRCGRLDAMTASALISGAPLMETPFKHLARSMDVATNTAVARSWSSRLAAAAGPPCCSPDPPAGAGRLTIGYLSADFHNHATAHLMLGVFGLHDRTRFRVIAYSTGPDDRSPYRARIRGDCDAFVDLAPMSDRAAAERIAADGVHILMDLKGYTRHHRLGICAHRPAPLAVAYLGFPGSTGAGFIDYLIADAVVVPGDRQALYTEKVLTMPHCYQVNDHCQPVARTGMTRAAAGLPETGFVFCAFHQAFKIEPVMFGLWMRILSRVPGSVLWLLEAGSAVRENLCREAALRGVAAERLIFAPRLDKALHLERTALADLGLDTRIYNGHTTTSDALWAGLPVIAVRGAHFASRVSASILSAAGLAGLCAPDLAAYEALAVMLATDPAALAAVRGALAGARTAAPLFDTRRFVGHLETALTAIWERHARGLPPAALRIDDGGPFFQPWPADGEGGPS